MFLRQFDTLSPPITLYYKKRNSHASLFSGILTILAYILIFSFVLIYFIRYINRENPTIYFFNRYVNDIGIFSFKDSNFFNYVHISQGKTRKVKEVDFNKVEIIGVNISMDGFINSGEDESHFNHWVYGKCNNETNTKGVIDLMNNETFNKSACIKKFYKLNDTYYDINDKNFEWPIIKHGVSNPNFSIFGVIVRKCQNTSFRLENFGICDSENEINEYIKNSVLSFFIKDNYVDILNYKNPVSNFLFKVDNGINAHSFLLNNLNFYPGLIKSFDDLFNDNFVEQTTYFFYQNSKQTYLIQNTQYLGAFYIWLQNSQQYYERHYHKIRDAMAEMGGYANIIIMLAKFINYLISKFNMLRDTQELISSVLKKNNLVYEKIIKTPSIEKFIGENDNLKNKNMTLNIKQLNSEPINTKMNVENAEDGKEDDKKIINHRINVINNNLGEETNRINKYLENSKQNIIIKKNPDEIKRQSTKAFIKHTFAKIDKNSSFHCWNYYLYLISCKKINEKIKYYEDLRRLIISEEFIFQNYFNMYKLLEIH